MENSLVRGKPGNLQVNSKPGVQSLKTTKVMSKPNGKLFG